MRKLLFLCSLLINSMLFSQNSTIDAAFSWDKNINYFFKGNIVVKFNFTQNKVESISKLSEGAFPGMSFKNLDAVLDMGNGKIYFFKGNQYIRFDKNNFRADTGYPKNTSNWQGISFSSIDAALMWPNKLYLFKGSQYDRFDKTNNTKDEGYPKAINSTLWPGLSFTNIDAALNSNNGKCYMFLGDNYIRYDIVSDKVDPGYPKNLSSWNGLKEALGGNGGKTNDNNNNNNGKTNDGVGLDEMQISEHTISLSPYNSSSPNSVLSQVQTAASHDGGFYMGFQQKNDVIIMKSEDSYNTQGNPIVLKGYWLSVMYPMNDGSLVVLVGKDVNNTYIKDYPNTLYFIKISKSGNVGEAKYIFGGKGHGPGKSWFDGRSKAVIDYNGSEFGIYFEVQKNWAEAGQKEDIHNGDMFVITDSEGNIKPDTEHFWTASHSSTINISAASSGDFYTMTIGDAYPYGLQVYNRNKSKNFIAWPPKEDYISYEEVNSTNAAGILEFCDENNGNLIAILGTLEHPNIGWDSKVDPLFLKFDTEGKIITKKWLKQGSEDESNISVAKYGDKYAIMWSAGNDYDNNWKATNGIFSIIDSNGNFIRQPEDTFKKFGTYSKIVKLKDNRIIWSYVDNGDSEVKIYELKLK